MMYDDIIIIDVEKWVKLSIIITRNPCNERREVEHTVQILNFEFHKEFKRFLGFEVNC